VIQQFRCLLGRHVWGGWTYRDESGMEASRECVYCGTLDVSGNLCENRGIHDWGKWEDQKGNILNASGGPPQEVTISVRVCGRCGFGRVRQAPWEHR
jgi:hypothetical protein